MLKNYEEALNHFHSIEQLNEKGLNELIGCLKKEIIDLKLKIIDLEHKLQYKDSKNKKSKV